MSWMGILSFKNSTQQLFFLLWIGFIVYPDVLDTWTYLWLRRDGHNIGEFETEKNEEKIFSNRRHPLIFYTVAAKCGLRSEYGPPRIIAPVGSTLNVKMN